MRASDVRPHRPRGPSSDRRRVRTRPAGGRLALVLYAATLGAGCAADRPADAPARESPPAGGTLFTRLPSAYTGVAFENRLVDTPELNVFTYRNYYNGGGVGIGDLNGDDLPDLVLTSNQRGSRLYLNQGEFRFRDFTEAAGIGGKDGWATGVTIADVDGDVLLDIYICYAGRNAGDRRANELYINGGAGEDGVPVFEEKAAAYGIADQGYTTHAAFFDYDRDGRLDLYLVNNSYRPVSSFGLRNIRHVRDSLGGDKLYHNLGSSFADVSEQAGIFGSEIGFGLGVAVSDFNRDGWPDLYVSNDFFERDYLYMNGRDGTFSEQLERQMPYISYFSMGLDVGDIDNDGWPDVYVTDMLPEDDRRLKLTSSFEGWDVYRTKLRNGYHHQFMRNMLHRNNADGTFSEIGQLAGVARTDWSWSALIADYDLDGLNDIFVTNGLARDVTSQDYISFLADDETMAVARRGERVDFLRLVEAMSSTPLPNYAFRNRGDLTFASEAASWGLDAPGFSNGAAYGDLDGDGALDLVVNNVNAEASVYRNNARALTDSRYLQVKLVGEGANRFAVGAKVTVHADGRLFFRELMPSRGFQSSVDYVLTFGLGTLASVDSVTVEWPDGRVGTVRDVAAGQCVVIAQTDAGEPPPAAAPAASPLFRDVTGRVALDYTHAENAFVDFDRERLMPKLVSTEGPFMAVADVNGDGLDDTFFGGAKDQPGRLLVQRAGGGFTAGSEAELERDRVSEDLGAVFFDATGDGAPDLYVVSGGNEFTDMAPALQDRLYVNDGRGVFRAAADRLPPMNISGSRAAPADFDGDGDIDLFVGGRVVPWRYGTDPQSVLLENDGTGRFADVTARAAPGLARIGMVTDALWHDVDGDGLPDLVVVGEWMPIVVFRNTGGRLERLNVPGLARSNGWWNRIVTGDFDGDGRTDFAVGNLGLNGRLHATPDEPATMLVKDFAGSGFVQQIISMVDDGVSYPLALRDDLIKSIPSLKARYLNYGDYAGQTVTGIFTPEQLSDAVVKTVHTFASSVVMNRGDGEFQLVPLPREAQVAPVHALLADDLDGDGRTDLLVAGNFGGFKPEIGAMTAGYGLFLKGDGGGGFTPVPARASGFRVPGEARDIARMRTLAGELLIVTRNDDRPLVFEVARARRVAGR